MPGSDPVARFEFAFADLIGSRYAIAVNSGTSALHTALVAMDVRGGEVIMPALCPAMDAFVIVHAGATPVFADVDPLTHLVTYETLSRVITPRTKAIIAVALHGLPCDIDAIRKLNIPIIEDCAQCLLGRYNSVFAGTKADIGCFSFENKKHLTTGSEGGMIVTNNPDLATAARKFAGIGYKHMTAEAGRTSLNAATFQRPSYERFDTVGLNYRLSHVQAEIGLEKLGTIRQVVKQRQEIGHMWEQALGQFCQPHTYDADNAFYSAAFEYLGDWERLYNECVMAGLDGFYAMPVVPYREPALSGRWSVICPVADDLQQHLVILKTHYKNMDYAQQQANILASII